jgi:hypothetical protein
MKSPFVGYEPKYRHCFEDIYKEIHVLICGYIYKFSHHHCQLIYVVLNGHISECQPYT